jgi:hypothetical protein
MRLALILVGCAGARPLAPLAKGQVAIDGALPSVIVEDEPPIRIPNPTIGLRYGVTEDVEARVTLHPVHLFLRHRPILGLGAGGIWHVAPADGLAPALHFTADLTLFAPLAGPRGDDEPSAILIADAAVIAHWEPLGWLYPYAIFGVAAKTTNDAPIASIFAGLQIWPKGIVAFSVEGGWFAFSIDADELTVPIVSPGWGTLYVGGAASFRIGARR